MRIDNVSRVAYMFGVLEGATLLDVNKLDFDNNDELFDYWQKVSDDWEQYVDIRNEEEEGYIITYAERVILQNYGRNVQ